MESCRTNSLNIFFVVERGKVDLLSDSAQLYCDVSARVSTSHHNYCFSSITLIHRYKSINQLSSCSQTSYLFMIQQIDYHYVLQLAFSFRRTPLFPNTKILHEIHFLAPHTWDFKSANFFYTQKKVTSEIFHIL